MIANECDTNFDSIRKIVNVAWNWNLVVFG